MIIFLGELYFVAYHINIMKWIAMFSSNFKAKSLISLNYCINYDLYPSPVYGLAL